MKQIINIIATLLIFTIIGCTKDGASLSSDAGNSSNGSLTKFITVGNYLYTVDSKKLNTYDISNPATPIFKTVSDVGFNIETIFPYGDKLFIGSNQNMYIYSIANPEVPTRVSTVTYFVRGRDPIVVKDTVAYSTLRINGTGGTLSVFNIKNINAPVNVFTTGITNPYGLGIKDSALYVCQGANGMSVFSIYKPHVPILKKQIANTETFYDVIVDNGMLFCFVKGGVYIYSLTNIFDPAFVAFVKN